MQHETLLPMSKITSWKIFCDLPCLSWSPAMLTQVAWEKNNWQFLWDVVSLKASFLIIWFQYCSVSLQTHCNVLLMLWINKQINNETKVSFFLCISTPGLVLLMCVCIYSTYAGRIMSSGICYVNKDGTVSHYWMEMNVCYEDDWQC